MRASPECLNRFSRANRPENKRVLPTSFRVDSLRYLINLAPGSVIQLEIVGTAEEDSNKLQQNKCEGRRLKSRKTGM